MEVYDTKIIIVIPKKFHVESLKDTKLNKHSIILPKIII